MMILDIHLFFVATLYIKLSSITTERSKLD